MDAVRKSGARSRLKSKYINTDSVEENIGTHTALFKSYPYSALFK